MKEKELSVREVKIDKTIFKVTSVFCGEKDFEKTVKSWAFNKMMEEIKKA